MTRVCIVAGSGACGGGVFSGVWVGVTEVRSGGVINPMRSGCTCGKTCWVSCFFAGVGVAFGPVVGCFPLFFLLLFEGNVFDGDPAHYREPAQFRNAVI